MMSRTRTLGIAGACLALALSPARAASDEIQVYLDELNAPGEIGLDTHVNDVLSGRSEPAWPGELTPFHTLQVTPEFSWGLSRHFEAGLYLPFARAADGGLYLNGLKLRMKYLARYGKPGWFYGLNVELSHVAERVSQEPWGLEVRPIVGWRRNGWLIAANPILGVPLRQNSAGTPEFEPAVKVSRELSEKVAIGLEHYASLGALNDLLPHDQQERLVVAAVDWDTGPVGLNLGVGYGYSGPGDRWVVKAIVGFRIR